MLTLELYVFLLIAEEVIPRKKEKELRGVLRQNYFFRKGQYSEQSSKLEEEGGRSKRGLVLDSSSSSRLRHHLIRQSSLGEM